MYYLSFVEEDIFTSKDGLKDYLCAKNYGLDYLEGSEVLVLDKYETICQENATIMKILLSLDLKAYIYDHYSMGTSIRLLLSRLMAFGDILLVSSDSQKQPIVGTDIFSGECFTEDPKTCAWATTASGPKKDFLGTFESWLYHILLNGPIHPATREPIVGFLGPLELFKAALPRCCKLTRNERLHLAQGLASKRPSEPMLNRMAIKFFEEDYLVPVDRSFYNLHYYDEDTESTISVLSSDDENVGQVNQLNHGGAAGEAAAAAALGAQVSYASNNNPDIEVMYNSANNMYEYFSINYIIVDD